MDIAKMLNQDAKRAISQKKPNVKAKGDTGKRYTDGQKKAILHFVSKQGRGGITAATRKYGVSYIALARWMKAQGQPAKKMGRPRLDPSDKKTANAGLRKALTHMRSGLERALKYL